MPPFSDVAVTVANFENKTTGTLIHDGKRQLDPRIKRATQAGNFSMTFIQFDPTGMIVGLPPQCCAKGHRIILTLNVKSGSESMNVKIIASVQSVESGIEDFDTVTLLFVSVDEAQWQKVQDLYQDKQASMAALFLKLKS